MTDKEQHVDQPVLAPAGQSVDDLANSISRWILAEDDETRKMAYIIANTYPDSAPLQVYLLDRIRNTDTPGVAHLRDSLSLLDKARLSGRLLPWVQVWSFVGIELCTRIGPELKPGEHAHLFHQLGILAIESER